MIIIKRELECNRKSQFSQEEELEKKMYKKKMHQIDVIEELLVRVTLLNSCVGN